MSFFDDDDDDDDDDITVKIFVCCFLAPSGPATGVRVEAPDQHTLKVFWKPPEKEFWNGEILGYYVGYKLASSEKPYLFETVEFSKEEGKEHHLQITNLK